MNTSRGRSAALATVAAARAAFPQEAMASRRGEASASASRCRARPMRWRALCVPVTLPVSSFTQSSTPRRSPSSGAGPPGVTRKPRPSISATRRSSRSTAATKSPSERPASANRRWAHSRRRYRRKGLSLSPSTSKRGPAGDPNQPLSAVRRFIGRSQPGQSAAQWSRRSAQCHHPAIRRSQPPVAAPLRALNSSIMASQVGTMACSRSQNAACRRASKSSSETPCCSTQVK